MEQLKQVLANKSASNEMPKNDQIDPIRRTANEHDHDFPPPPPPPHECPLQSLVTRSITSVTRFQRFLTKGFLFTGMSFNVIPLLGDDDDD